MKEKNIKKALVCGAAGFVGAHLVKRLKKEGYWVRGVARRRPEFSPIAADDFLLLDLREKRDCQKAMETPTGPIEEVYQLAADMGGIGYISKAQCDIMKNNILINVNMVDAAASRGVKRYFFSSSVCVYRDMMPGEVELKENDALPANPDNEYGWEKLYSERMVMEFAQKYGFAARIARFQTTYGPEGTWVGGKEKAPAAICRKAAEAKNGGVIKVWGNGTAIRSYLYIDDLIEGIYLLMQSKLEGPVNIGSPEYVSVKELVDTVMQVSGKRLNIKYVKGPVGVHSRNFSNKKIYSIGWKAKIPLKKGIALTYPWIEKQVCLAQKGK